MKKNAAYLIRAGVVAALFFVFLRTFSYDIISAIIIVCSLLMTFQGLITIYLMLYSRNRAQEISKYKSPRSYIDPNLRFSAIIPAREEAGVIGDTLHTILNINYPVDLSEVIVVCQKDDVETIAAVRRFSLKNNRRVKVRVYNKPPFNKPHALNVGLAKATGDVIAVFDAEDEPHRDIYRIINTVMNTRGVDVVQSGVQLMNYGSNWFSALNVLEYFFWFKSALQFFARHGVIPLGGNTVFFRKQAIDAMNGWNEASLTEDAEIGFRLSGAGYKTAVVYDELHVTREETPDSTMAFIRQRTRWNQGYLQILMSGIWRSYPTFSQRLLALYTLMWPVFQGLFFVYALVSLWFITQINRPVEIVLISLLPMYLLILQFVVLNVGLYEFCRSYRLPYKWLVPLRIALGILPFYIILSFSGVRALLRLTAGNSAWEKTHHANTHRQMDLGINFSSNTA